MKFIWKHVNINEKKYAIFSNFSSKFLFIEHQNFTNSTETSLKLNYCSKNKYKTSKNSIYRIKHWFFNFYLRKFRINISVECSFDILKIEFGIILCCIFRNFAELTWNSKNTNFHCTFIQILEHSRNVSKCVELCRTN